MKEGKEEEAVDDIFSVGDLHGHLLLLLVNPLQGHLLHVVQVTLAALQFVVQVSLLNNFAQILKAHLEVQRNRFQDRQEIRLIQLKESVFLQAGKEKEGGCCSLLQLSPIFAQDQNQPYHYTAYMYIKDQLCF